MSPDVLELVYSAIDEVNGQFESIVIEKQRETPLLGGEGGVDSVAFLNLIVAIEGLVQQKHGVTVVLVDEGGMALQEGPFRTVETLARYVERLLRQQHQN